MATDLTVILEHRPGTLAHLGETLGAAGVNVEGITAMPCEGQATVHILVHDPAAVRTALGAAGIEVLEEREVMLFPIQDRPGEMGRIARQVADEEINLELVYLATGNRAVIGADDIGGVRKLLE
jgi:hypothetical protein